MSGTSFRLGVMSCLILAVGCAHSAKSASPEAAGNANAAATQNSAAPAAKPAVKESQTTVTVHNESKKSDKKKAEKSKPAATGEAPTGGYLCASGGDERKLALKSTPSGGCEVLYTKAGNTTSIAHADHETSYCEKALEKTKANLEKAGYNCSK